MKNKKLKISHKILEAQSQKLKQKLQVLRAQVQLKKKEKELNKTTSSNLNSIDKGNESCVRDPQLLQLLEYLQIDANKLIARGISQYSQLINVSQEQIDKWKDIPVGRRVRLRKYLQNVKQQMNQSRTIQDIVKVRKEEVQFIPLEREMDQELSFKQLNQEDQQIMIKSLISTFNPKKQQSRPSAFKKSKFTKKCQVKWHPSVINYQGQTIYPKQSMPKTNYFVAQQRENEKKYCWQCFKSLANNQIKLQTRDFCSENCLLEYKMLLHKEVPQFFSQMQLDKIDLTIE